MYLANVRSRPCPTPQHALGCVLRGRSAGVGHALLPALPKEGQRPILPEKNTPGLHRHLRGCNTGYLACSSRGSEDPGISCQLFPWKAYVSAVRRDLPRVLMTLCSTPLAAVVVAVPIRKLCPQYLRWSTSVRASAARTSSTKHFLVKM